MPSEGVLSLENDSDSMEVDSDLRNHEELSQAWQTI